MKHSLAVVVSILLILGFIRSERAISAPPVDLIKPPIARGPATKPAEPMTSAKQMLQPTRINFKCTNLSPDDAVEALESAAGWSMHAVADDTSFGAKVKVTCDDKNQPVMTVVKEVGEQGQITVAGHLVRNTPSTYFHSDTKFQMSRSFFPKQTDSSIIPVITDFNTSKFHVGQKVSAVNARIMFLAEPKVYIVGYYSKNPLQVALDDQNRSILFPEPPELSTASKNSRPAINYFDNLGDCNFQVAMKVPGPPAKSIKQISGSINLILGFSITTKDLSEALVEGKSATLAFGKGNTITFSDFEHSKRDSNEYTLTMSVPRFKMPNGKMVEESDELRHLHLEAMDADGKRDRVMIDIPRGVQDKFVEFTIKFWPQMNDLMEGHRKPPVKLIVTMPGRTEEVSIPFEFDNLPIPEGKK